MRHTIFIVVMPVGKDKMFCFECFQLVLSRPSCKLNLEKGTKFTRILGSKSVRPSHRTLHLYIMKKNWLMLCKGKEFFVLRNV